MIRAREGARDLDRFRAMVLQNGALQEKLRAADADGFLMAVVDIARGHGLSLAADDVWAQMRRSSDDSGGAADDHREAPLPPRGWLPLRASWRRDQLQLDWFYVGEERFIEPFFEDSVRRCLSRPFNRLFRCSTPLTALPAWLRAHPGLSPRGFIFHMSRCGSTLVSRMLAARPDTIVMSEAAPVDAVVQARQMRPDLTEEQHALWLAWMILTLGQARGGERHYVLKLDSWHTLALPLFRRAFPSVPWIFLYREPVEVLVSQLRKRGIHTVPGLLGSLFGIDPSHAAERPEEYCARVLAKICEPVLWHYPGGRGRLIAYRELPAALWTMIMPHFGMDWGERDRAAMADTARYDAKAPGLQFAADAEAKQRAATERTRSAAAGELGDIHRRLEALRLDA